MSDGLILFRHGCSYYDLHLHDYNSGMGKLLDGQFLDLF